MESYPKLFIPGPTHVPDDVLQSLTVPQIGHRTPEMSELMETLVTGVQKVLYTLNHVYITSHAATGLWEMGIRNGVKKGILHAVNGAFSSKWATVSQKCGMYADSIEYTWGKGIKAEDVDAHLSSGKFDVFAMVHNETSTGVQSDLEAISQMLKSKYPDVLFMVDAVSSMAGSKIEVDNLGIDFILSSTQKAWGLPAGFSICAISDRMIEISKTIENKGYFFDVEVYEKYFAKMQTPTTPSFPHMFGLKYILSKIEKEGLENRWNRHIEMSHYTQNWAKEHGQSLFAEEGCASNTITCINNDQEWDINAINDRLLAKGYRMDRGYGNLRTKAFRIAHMGNVYMEDLQEYLNIFDGVING